MVKIKSFKGVRPAKELASQVASRPYDVLNREEALNEANEVSFLHVIRSEIDLADDISPYDKQVYGRARENFDGFFNNGVLIQDEAEDLYVYQQTMGEHSQTGLVACSSIDDYFNDHIKKHEFTRPVKEQDRINHITTTGIHSGPVFLTYNDVDEIDSIIDEVKNHEPEYDFVANDDVRHVLWSVKDSDKIERLIQLFETQVSDTYIADGHHRAASSAKVGKELANANPNHTGDEAYNYFLSVIFPASQLKIIDYNRVVKDLNGMSNEEFIDSLANSFDIEEVGDKPFKPGKLHEFGMYLGGKWYKLIAKQGTYNDHDPIEVLDVTVLSNNLLDPILGIKDQRTDDRIDFVGGIRGLQELSKRVDSGEMKVAFALYPVTIEQLINIADSGKVMPPKSTWFEPKLRSGLIVHQFQ